VNRTYAAGVILGALALWNLFLTERQSLTLMGVAAALMLAAAVALGRAPAPAPAPGRGE
jgi:hypothetical protein